MKFKNTRRLVKRAQGHKDAKRLGQGAYLERTADGYDGFEGGLRSKNSYSMCAVACLATPVKKSKIKEVMKISESSRYESEFYFYMKLREDFGIPGALAMLADDLFEASSPKDAKVWPLELATVIDQKSGTEVDEEMFEGLSDKYDCFSQIDTANGPGQEYAPLCRETVLEFITNL